MEKMTKVELGCGSTKNDGYIGIDRFPLPNVDIVADLNKGIPLDDNSVDVIFCSHSLEHFDDISNIISEIYRICKHKAIVNILSPYYMETVNLANFYHKQVFNEATFRFFTNDSKVPLDVKEYYNPHASSWALGSSDNSDNQINLYTLNIEYFYFPSYIDLTDEEKRNARRSLLNVCDQIYYSLAVNKSGSIFLDEEINELKEKANREEVSIITTIRNRKNDKNFSSSIIDDIRRWNWKIEESLEEKLNDSEQRLSSKMVTSEKVLFEHLEDCEENLSNRFMDTEKELFQDLKINEKNLSKKLNDSENKINYKINKVASDNIEKIEATKKDFSDKIEVLNSDILKEVENLQNQIKFLTAEKNSLSVIALDLIKSEERETFIRKHLSLFYKRGDLFDAISVNHAYFAEGLTLGNIYFNKNSIVNTSRTIPYEYYFEYKITGYGSKINFFLLSNIGARIFLEVVLYGKIVKQESFTVYYEGMYTCLLNEEIRGRETYIRFRTLDNMSICRVLEVVNRKKFFFEKRALAYFVE